MMTHRERSRRFLLASLALLTAAVALPTSAPAQDQEPDTAQTPVYRLQGITVTVTRSREELLKLPYAAGLVEAAEIQGLERTVSLDESLLIIPGVFVDNRYNFALGNRISVRGFGSRAQFGVRGIRIVQDGIPLTMADGQAQLNNLDLATAGRIEVIRGPASSLYGNASGGVISITTQEPPLVPFQPELRVLAGGYGDDRYYQKYDLQAAGRSGRFDYTGHVGYFDTDGFRLHSASRSTLVNTRVRYHPDDRSTLTFVGNYSNTPEAENPSSLTDSLARANPDTVRDIVLPQSECPADPAFGGCQDLGEASEQGQAGLSYRRSLTPHHEITVAAYGLFRDLENPIPFTLILLDRRAAGSRLEYRYRPSAGVLEGLTAGLDVDHQSDDRREFARDDSGTGAIQLDQQEKVTSLGLFASATVAIAEPLRLTVAGRYDRVRFDAEDDLVGGGNPDDSGARTLDQLSPTAGLSYSPAPWFNAYANVGRGFQTPTTTEFTDTLGGFNQALEPERSTNYEVGFKGAALDRLSYTLAFFLADIEDQLIAFEPEGLDRTFFTNAGSSEHRGIEADISALLTRGLTLRAAYTFSDFEFDQFADDSGDFGGNEVPGIPPHKFRGELFYRHPTGLHGAVKLTAVDGFFVDNANEVRNDGYTTVDLRFGYSGGSQLRVAPFVGIDNVFDVRYNSSVTVNAFGGRFFEPAPGRNLYAGVRLIY